MRSSGKRALEPLRALGEPIADVIGMQPYAAWQTAFDPLLTPGAYNYWKSHNFVELERRPSQHARELCGEASDWRVRDFHWPARRGHQPRGASTPPPILTAMRIL